MPEERRKANRGRRESDRILNALWRELDGLERDLRRDLDRLERALDGLEEKLGTRVDQLAQHNIAERAKIGERTREEVEQVKRTDRKWNRVAVGFGVVGVLAAIIEPFLLK